MLDELDDRGVGQDPVNPDDVESDQEVEDTLANEGQEDQELFALIDQAREAGVSEREIEDTAEMENEEAKDLLEQLTREAISGRQEDVGASEEVQGRGQEPGTEAAQGDLAETGAEEQQRLQRQRELEEAQRVKDERRQGTQGDVGLDEGRGGADLFSPDTQQDLLGEGTSDKKSAPASNLPSDMPRTMYRGYGRPETEKESGTKPQYASVKQPVLGKGKYYALNKKSAERFGPEVEERDVPQLENPLIIQSDQEWRGLVQDKLGWEFPMPGERGATKEEDVAKLESYLEDNGYDGVVAWWDDSLEADWDNQGRGIKTLRKVFDTPQVFVPAWAENASKDKASQTDSNKSSEPGQDIGRGSSNVEQEVKDLAQQSNTGRVRLADLADRLPDMPAPEMEQNVKSLVDEQKAVISPLENPQEIGKRDKDAAIELGGDPHHALYWRGDSGSDQGAEQGPLTDPIRDETGAFEPAQKQDRQVKDNYRDNLSKHADRVYSETSPGKAFNLLPNDNSSPKRRDMYFSDTPEMARGQGEDAGVLMAFDASQIEGQVNRDKPGLEQAYERGQGEYIARGEDEQSIRNGLISIRISDDAKKDKNLERMENTLADLRKQGWKKSVGNGFTEWTNPSYPTMADSEKTSGQRQRFTTVVIGAI